MSTHRSPSLAPKPPDDKTGSFKVCIFEAAARGLRRSATMYRSQLGVAACVGKPRTQAQRGPWQELRAKFST